MTECGGGKANNSDVAHHCRLLDQISQHGDGTDEARSS